MSRVLVTGAGGFVGSHLALGLSALGFEVIAHDIAFDPLTTTRLRGLERLTCEMRVLGDRVEAVDFVIHGAAITAQPDEVGLKEAALLKLNVELTLGALHLAQRHRVNRFVLISSAGVFSPNAPAPLNETAQPDGLGLYATAKRTGELAARSLRACGALEAVSVRLGNLYGPHERPRATRPRMSLVARLLGEAAHTATLSVTTPEARREWTHVQNLAPAIAKLLGNPAPADITHLCAPDIVTDRALTEKLQSLLPGTRLEFPPDSKKLPVRPPLESCVTGTLGLTHWTPLDVGLGALVREQLPA